MSTISAKRVALIARRKLPQASATLEEAAEWLSAHGATPVIELESARRRTRRSLDERAARYVHGRR